MIVVKQKRSHGCLIAFLVVVALIIVIVVIAAAAANKSSNDKAAANAKTCAGLSYPDHQSTDQCADAQGQVKLEGYTVTASNIHRVAATNEFIGPEICADVTYLNRAAGSSNFNEFDWKLQTPAGVVQSFEITDANLGSGQIVAGGTKSGTVCFKDNGETGQFVLIWKGDPFVADRGIWVTKL